MDARLVGAVTAWAEDPSKKSVVYVNEVRERNIVIPRLIASSG
jgi:hypothetical protein